MSQPDRAGAALRVASVALYVLAGITLLLGGYLGLSLINAPSAIRGATIAFQTPVLAAFNDMVAQGFVQIGALVLILTLLLSAMLIAAGLLIARTLALSARVRRLEAALEQARLLPPVTDAPRA